MVSKKTTIINQQGLHMRPASEFAKVVTKYDCNVIHLTYELPPSFFMKKNKREREKCYEYH